MENQKLELLPPDKWVPGWSAKAWKECRKQFDIPTCALYLKRLREENRISPTEAEKRAYLRKFEVN